jgi:hypothetical protein
MNESHPVFIELSRRFPEATIVHHNEVPLVYIPRTRERNYHLISTLGMSDFDMEVPERFSHQENIELFFCLPDYWKHDDMENPNHKWVWDQIAFMSPLPKERETWFGSGHTIPFKKDESEISEKYQQAYFLMIEPFVLEREMQPFTSGDNLVTFLSIVPLFKKEFDYKNKSGAHHLLRKFLKKGVSEKVDMFRLCVVKRKRLLF